MANETLRGESANNGENESVNGEISISISYQWPISVKEKRNRRRNAWRRKPNKEETLEAMARVPRACGRDRLVTGWRRDRCLSISPAYSIYQLAWPQ